MSHRQVVKHGQPGSRQAHRNREKFNPYRHKDLNDRLDQSILDTMTSLCCKRCCDVIQWKVDFGKYEVLDRPKTCNVCREKNIAIAYHHICQECAKQTIRCAKCQRPASGLRAGSGENTDGLPQEAHEQSAQHSETDCDGEGEDEDGAEANASRGCADEHAASPAPPKARVPASLLKYAFVDVLDSDPEFHAFCGLDIRRLKNYKRRVRDLEEKHARDGLRERERRTVLRKKKLAEGKGNSGGNDSDFMNDSDEEM